jgi:hypothetical protein
MISVTGTEIIDVIRQFGALEWGRWSPLVEGREEKLAQPPVIIWRYKDHNETLERLIEEAVHSFKGNVEWEMRRPGRNWVIAPVHVREFYQQGGFRVDVEAHKALADQDPSFGVNANSDLPRLAEHIRTFVSSKMPVLTAVGHEQ